tara:strand:- start:42 stop:293 length:252 start_codon:yes stop_codon:yes gene_type:complete
MPLNNYSHWHHGNRLNLAGAKLIFPTLFVVTNCHRDYLLTAAVGDVDMSDDDKNDIRRRNLALGAVLALAALGMYFGIFVKMY